MTTQTETTVYRMELDAPLIEEMGRLEGAVDAADKSWGKYAKTLGKTEDTSNELIKSIEALGERGKQAAAKIKAIADPVKRLEAAQVQLKKQVQGQDGVVRAFGKLEDKALQLRAQFAGLPVPLQAAALGGFAVAGAAALGAATAITKFTQAALTAAVDASPAAQEGLSDLTAATDAFTLAVGQALLSGVDLEQVLGGVAARTQELTAWVEANEATFRSITSTIATVGQVGAYVFSVTLPLALAPLILLIDGIRLGIAGLAVLVTGRAADMAQALAKVGVVSQETADELAGYRDVAVEMWEETDSLVKTTWDASQAVRDFGDDLAGTASDTKKARDELGTEGLAGTLRNVHETLRDLVSIVDNDYVRSISGMAVEAVKAGKSVAFVRDTVGQLNDAFKLGVISAEEYQAAVQESLGLIDKPQKKTSSGPNIAEEQAQKARDLQAELARDEMQFQIDLANSAAKIRLEREEAERQAFEASIAQRWKAHNDLQDDLAAATRNRVREEARALKQGLREAYASAKDAAKQYGITATEAFAGQLGAMATSKEAVADFGQFLLDQVGAAVGQAAEVLSLLLSAWVAAGQLNPLAGLALTLLAKSAAAAISGALSGGGGSTPSRSAAAATRASSSFERRDRRDDGGDTHVTVVASFGADQLEPQSTKIYRKMARRGRIPQGMRI